MLQYRERIIFLSKAVDEELGNQLVATMLYLDSVNKKDMQLYINCSGGDVCLHPPPDCNNMTCLQRVVTHAEGSFIDSTITDAALVHACIEASDAEKGIGAYTCIRKYSPVAVQCIIDACII